MKINTICLIFFLSMFAFQAPVFAQKADNRKLSLAVRNDHRLDTIQARALRLLTGFNAGTSYGEVWIRDFNTFIKGSLKVHAPEKVKDMLLLFFKMQGNGGDIVDGFIDIKKAYVGYEFRYFPAAPDWVAHKNTVETDQESSLIQAIRKYIDVTGDTAILQEKIGEKTVIRRMEEALAYVHNERWAEEYGLVKGATTVDWGDVQPETGWGVVINHKTKWALDIYDNAMYLIAIQDFLTMKPASYQPAEDWASIALHIKENVRKHLWETGAQKYIPHLYLNGSPFPASFNEKEMLYTGGSACAILAGLHTPEEIAAINKQMVDAAAKEKFATIGITVYPPYPAAEFPNMHPYVYQNAGDWTWFGGRMIQALIANGMIKEAWEELQPIMARTIARKGFYEWYDVRTGEPKGSGDFRGEAGVLFDTITMLREWAEKNK
ncbi:GH36-type glycosyl hydrolase domain-containing protein [Chitinophaga sp. CF418]|uniref:GH36-type glycosyl hydrolase domain-containing protein n=1 Tax=Chitinophaga sp. CF418 TaxID=1855287 RepID=UPI00090F7286|nr:hypothetical protein [Chitinophaga sp. CF418]SHN44305.1 hypothetical protein SAMN05216311_11737 [Chitinophaga sp. CF418]